jgi:hypothetical protein
VYYVYTVAAATSNLVVVMCGGVRLSVSGYHCDVFYLSQNSHSPVYRSDFMMIGLANDVLDSWLSSGDDD